MPAPKGNKNAVGNKGGGRPSKYKREYAELAYKYALLGATDDNLAYCFGVAPATIETWKKTHVEFSSALRKGKEEADARVAERLFTRALGYEQEAVKIFNQNGVPLIVPYKERIAPDVTAAIFWLKNRRPDVWRDKRELESTVNVNVSFEDRLRNAIQRSKVNGHAHPDANTGRAATGPHSVIRQ